jgi:hypothetical protein
MTVQADITTDRRRVIEFFLSPVVKYMDEGLKVGLRLDEPRYSTDHVVFSNHLRGRTPHAPDQSIFG